MTADAKINNPTHCASERSPLAYAATASRLILGALFVFAAYVKLSMPQEFIESVRAFKIFDGKPLPDHLATLATFALPWTEMACGILLILGLWTRSAALILASLLAVFIVALVLVLRLPGEIECGCFGKFEIPCGKIVGPCHVVRNCVLLGLTGLVLVVGPGRLSFDAKCRQNGKACGC